MLRRVLVGVGSLHAVAAAPLRRGAARMSSGSAIGLRVDHAQVALRSADAVCFDVDSTVIRVEGIDELAAYLGVGDKVAALTAAAMGGDVPFHEVRTNPARSLSHARYMCACAPFASADTPPFPHMSHPVSPICQKSILVLRRSHRPPVAMINRFLLARAFWRFPRRGSGLCPQPFQRSRHLRISSRPPPPFYPPPPLSHLHRRSKADSR